ncbi:DUF2142 domain-containing protein [Candidatus Clostridium helianthi]|uniref:DUF2142 domain-containing protein n=1 Tax=Candidatus Clostridium helianthi TaxID=3381660 RepID=A0ABW8RYZ1_9CLOT
MNIIRDKLHNYFFSIAVILGVVLIVFGPPMSVPDEQAHFLNAYSIADGQIFLQKSNDQLGKYFPKNVITFANENGSKFLGIDSPKYNFKDYYYNSYLIAENEGKVFYKYFNQNITPISYIFSSLGIFVGKILLPQQYELPFNLLLFGRIFNFLFYVITIYFAIKITPYYKNTLFLLALMPMSVYLGASVSYDALLIPSAFLLFAYILKLRESESILVKDIIIVCSILFILFAVKQAYAHFVLVLLAIPVKSFDNRKRYYKIIFIAGLVCIIGFALGQINNLLAINIGQTVDEKITLQQQYLNNNIGIMIPLIIRSFMKYKLFYFNGIVGVFGQLDTNIPFTLIIIFAIILLWVIIIDSCNAAKISINFKLLGIISLLIFIYFSFRAMYINWTPLVESLYGNTITGIQGRYFIPTIPFVSAVFANNFFGKYSLNNKLLLYNTNLVYYTGILFSVVTGLTIILRYWT